MSLRKQPDQPAKQPIPNDGQLSTAPSDAAEEKPRLFSNFEYYLSISMCMVDIVSCSVSYFTSFSKVQCCDNPDALTSVALIIWTTIFLTLVLVDLALLIKKRSFFLTIINPTLGYAMTIVMLHSAGFLEALVSLFLSSVSMVVDCHTLFKLAKDRPRNNRESHCCSTSCNKFIFCIIAGLLNILLSILAVYAVSEAVHFGGVCIMVTERDPLFANFEYGKLPPPFCDTCPDGTPALHSRVVDGDWEERMFPSNCPGEESLGSFCPGNASDYCFVAW